MAEAGAGRPDPMPGGGTPEKAGTRGPGSGRETGGPLRTVHGGRVLVVVAIVVAAILAANVLSALIPGMDDLLAGWPIVVLLLVVVTVAVLLASARGSPRA